ncbi:MAG: hypothetical protein ACJ75H_04895 [Thermoanaerobaculia bacterium]
MSSETAPLLDWDVPTTEEDIRALRENRPRLGDDRWERLQEAVDQLPGVQAALRRRRTFEGFEPFEL